MKGSNVKLITNTGTNEVLETIVNELKHCNSYSIIVAFITKEGVNLIKGVLNDLSSKGVKGNILTGTYLNFTDPEAIEELNKIQNINIRLSESNLHAKGSIFSSDGVTNVLIGSSNLTQSALRNNTEWNMLYKNVSSEFFSTVKNEFDLLWNNALSITPEVLSAYKLQYDTKKEMIKKSLVSANKSTLVYNEEILPEVASLFFNDGRKLISNNVNYKSSSDLVVGGIYTKLESFEIINPSKSGYSQQLSYLTASENEFALYFDVSSIYGDKIVNDTTVEWESTKNRSIYGRGKESVVSKISKDSSYKHLFIKTPQRSKAQYYYLGPVKSTTVLEAVTKEKKNTRLQFKLYETNADKVNIIRSLYK